MKKSLSEYLSMPGYTNLSKETRKLMPILEDPYDYIMNGDIVVKYWPLPSVIKESVLDILHKHHGDNPGRVENKLFIKGVFFGGGMASVAVLTGMARILI